MSLPCFLDRVVDAAEPLLGGLDRDGVRARLETASVRLVAGPRAADGSTRAGFLLAANLAARLYPRVDLGGPDELVRLAACEITLVNPRAAIAPVEQPTAVLGFEVMIGAPAAVAVFARGWNVYVDEEPSGEQRDEDTAVPAALCAAAIGVGELFRIVFADELGERGRRAPQPGAFNLVTLGQTRSGLVVPAEVSAGEFRLVGAGAIGQAAAHTLSLAAVRGTMVAVDGEHVTPSNLQRYVLARDTDVGAVKVDLLRERLAASLIEVVPVHALWHVGLVDGQRPTLVGVDSPEARIAIQASLPGAIYNAWTQPADVGWSRHERFGAEPCLACLYWPTERSLSRHEQIAAAFRQHPLRVLAYLVHRQIPIGLPLPPGGIPMIPGFEAPPDADRWVTTPLLDDIAAAARVDVAELAAWRDRPLADVYQDGICGGALLHLNVGSVPREVIVPLAHQSALAGVMLATQLIVATVPDLKLARGTSVEARYDALAGLPQHFARPRQRTAGCLCADSDFLDVYSEKFSGEPLPAALAHASAERSK